MPTALDLYRASATEKDIQAGIVRRLRLLGYTVEETGKTRATVTCPDCGHRHVPTGWQGNTVGCPDLYVSRQAWGNTWLALEVKKPGGRVQAEQRALAGLGMSRIVTSQDEAEAACREMDVRVRRAV